MPERKERKERKDVLIKLDPENLERLRAFKRVFDAAIGERSSFELYVNVVIMQGLLRMLRDSIPDGMEWEAIIRTFQKRPDAVTQILEEVFTAEADDEKRKKARSSFLNYIA